MQPFGDRTRAQGLRAWAPPTVLLWRPHRAGFPAQADDPFAVLRWLPQVQGPTPPGNRKRTAPITCSFHVTCLLLATRGLCGLAGFSRAVGPRSSRAALAAPGAQHGR